MQFERLRKNHKRKIIIGGLILVCVISAITITTTRAKYKLTEDIPLVRGNINYKSYDFKIMAMYKREDGTNYTEINDRMPSTGYIINEERSYCTIDNKTHDTKAKLYTYNGKHIFENLAKSDKCYLYFNKKVSAGETVLSNVTIKSGIPNFSTVSTTDEGVYKTQDETGKDTYYFRGAVTNNYIKFGKHSHDLYFGYYNSTSEYYRMYDSLSKCQNSTNGYKTNCKIGIKAGTDMYWRIIRINSNESIRIFMMVEHQEKMEKY